MSTTLILVVHDPFCNSDCVFPTSFKSLMAFTLDFPFTSVLGCYTIITVFALLVDTAAAPARLVIHRHTIYREYYHYYHINRPHPQPSSALSIIGIAVIAPLVDTAARLRVLLSITTLSIGNIGNIIIIIILNCPQRSWAATP
ncbi:hypothetical protein C8R46DRAFT_1213309 [Mycena filopes]|nr:hypothetical protein C8R46DRAFT_1213309 [Mycena filopes]